jgi:hypothetical protein
MLTVLTPAETYDLTTLETVKTEMEISGSAQDVFLGALIRQASGDVARYCMRVFALETVREVFRSTRLVWRRTDFADYRFLARVPVVSVASIVEDGTGLVEGVDFEVDIDTGRLARLSGGDTIYGYGWGSVTTVEYSGGYQLLPSLPYDIERATIDLVKRRYYSRSRDPALRSQEVLDLVNKSFTAEGSEPMKRGLPRSIAERLDEYVRLPL